MRIDLVQYLKKRYQERDVQSLHPGPVLTIARESGCPGKKIAQRITQLLNEKLLQQGKVEKWKWVGKEIILEAARELEIEPDQVEKVVKEKRTIVDEIISAQTQRFYKSDRRVQNTIKQVIRSMANDGHVVILGRGGIAITRDIPRSLHIFLEAPPEWRGSIIAHKQNCSLEDAMKYAREIDERRAQYRSYYHGKDTDYTWFDARFNCMTLCVDEIAEATVKLMELRKLI